MKRYHLSQCTTVSYPRIDFEGVSSPSGTALNST